MKISSKSQESPGRDTTKPHPFCRFRKLVLAFLGFLIILFGKLIDGYVVNGNMKTG